MPEPTRYKTLNGQPPNGGVPPSRMFAAVAGPPIVHDALPPNAGMPPSGHSTWSPPPAYAASPPTYAPAPPPHSSSSEYPPSLLRTFFAKFVIASWSLSVNQYGPPRAAVPPPAPSPTHHHPPPTTTNSAPFEPPGQLVSGQMLHGPGWTYLAPAEHTTIMFVGNGARPCDHPGGYYPWKFPFTKHKVPSNMTLKELIKQLGCPQGPGTFGVTEMIQLGDGHWAAGSTFTQGGDERDKTLAEVGWTARRDDDYPVWLVVKSY
ncbi:hypothetical protein P7C71_g5286, partial [Lecanoromycetidae sp. Uapishka_2]